MLLTSNTDEKLVLSKTWFKIRAIVLVWLVPRQSTVRLCALVVSIFIIIKVKTKYNMK